ncbi:MAG: hypothetical protein LBK71_02955 [Verrucomicrobiales bacterium]|jgi:hypothetical protein|nr:hypothetical protein [Verrucomicrobiales bacterium]
MEISLKSLAFSLDDTVKGTPLTPATVDIPTFFKFLEEVQKLLKGQGDENVLVDSRFQLEAGSVKIVAFVTASLALSVTNDIERLRTTGDLDTIDPVRAKVVEIWQNKVKRTLNRSYAFAADTPKASFRITQNSTLQHKAANYWVSVEKYLSGKIVDLGGKTFPNIHLVSDSTDDTLTIGATEAQLAGEKENQIYKEVTLHVQAEQHLGTKQLRNIQLLAFVPQAATVTPDTLEKLWQKGREAWRDIGSASAWVDSLRGNV